jgi:hypothetical protein
LAIDPTSAIGVCAAVFVSIGATKALLWRSSRNDARDAAGRRVLLHFAVIDTFVQSVSLVMIVGAPFLGLGALAAVLVAGAAKIVVVDGPLERWRDARLAACNAAHDAATVEAA